jgi:hypothetical protein
MRIRIMIVLTIMFNACSFAYGQQTQSMTIEVFPFELEDKSAGAGIIPPDEHDKRYLAESE